MALSPSQISRRRQRLEEEGVIRAYHAEIDREKTGLDLLVVITVTLSRHKSDTAKRFAALVRSIPEVRAKGAEVDAIWRPIEGLSVQGGVRAQDAATHLVLVLR